MVLLYTSLQFTNNDVNMGVKDSYVVLDILLIQRSNCNSIANVIGDS